MGTTCSSVEDVVEFEKIMDEENKSQDHDSTQQPLEDSSQKPDEKYELLSLSHTNSELQQRINDLEERIRKRQVKNDVKVAQLKTSKKKLKRRTEKLKTELLDTQQQLFENRSEYELVVAEKEQLEKRLK